MKNVILISHGTLAYGMHSILDMFAGKKEEIKSLCLEDGMSTDEFKTKFIELLTTLDKTQEILLFTDILGGSPFSTAVELLSEKKLFEKTSIFNGMNAPMCLTAVLSKDSMNKQELEKIILDDGKEGISCYQNIIEENEEENL